MFIQRPRSFIEMRTPAATTAREGPAGELTALVGVDDVAAAATRGLVGKAIEE